MEAKDVSHCSSKIHPASYSIKDLASNMRSARQLSGLGTDDLDGPFTTQLGIALFKRRFMAKTKNNYFAHYTTLR